MTKQNTKILTYIILVMVFIFPSALVFGTWNAIYNHIFSVLVAFLYASNGKIEKRTLIFWGLTVIIAVYTRRYGFIDMIIIPILGDFVKNKAEVKKLILKSNTPYICIFFYYCILYTLYTTWNW